MGNWLNREWTQIELSNEATSVKGSNENIASQSQPKADLKSKASKLIKRKNSNLANEADLSYAELNNTNTDNVVSTPVVSNAASKVVVADIDPRSPTSGIVRYIIYIFLNNPENILIFKNIELQFVISWII